MDDTEIIAFRDNEGKEIYRFNPKDRDKMYIAAALLDGAFREGRISQLTYLSAYSILRNNGLKTDNPEKKLERFKIGRLVDSLESGRDCKSNEFLKDIEFYGKEDENAA